MPWIVTAEETSGKFTHHGGYVPTIGSKAQAVDLYRTVYYQGEDVAESGYSITDIASTVALAKIVEGNVNSIDDLSRAETALQALLLSDAPQVYVPAIKVFHSNGFVGYHRADKGFRTRLAFELFNFETSWDFIAAVECVGVEDGIIARSSDIQSKLVGKKLEDLTYYDLIDGRSPSAAPLVLSDMLRIPSYFSEVSIQRARRGDGFPKRFYNALNVSWDKAVSDIPPITCSFSIPPLLAIILNQANNRQDIPSTINDLRQELVEVRSELYELNNLATHAMGQAEIESCVQRIEQSFYAIVPESRLTRAEKIARRFFVMQKVIAPILRYGAGFFLNNGNSLESMFNVSSQVLDSLVKTERIVDRTQTATQFVDLVKTDSIQQLVKHHFDEQEILAIEKSLDSR